MYQVCIVMYGICTTKKTGNYTTGPLILMEFCLFVVLELLIILHKNMHTFIRHNTKENLEKSTTGNRNCTHKLHPYLDMAFMLTQLFFGAFKYDYFHFNSNNFKIFQCCKEFKNNKKYSQTSLLFGIE